MKKYKTILVGAAMGLFFIAGINGYDDADLDDMATLSGSVSQISEKKISVSNYNWEAGESQITDFKIDPDTRLENVGSLDEVNVDDTVEVVYISKSDGKVVRKIIINPEINDESGSSDVGGYDDPGDIE